ncbi:MAG: peptidylprolyl isomerase [Candidatus Lokiarchaeota archaeon]|nr:peptidylprolyl isomerase [Candidatus Lokiarchaeota archaeon]
MTNLVIKTNKGDINLQLFDEDAPLTVASFLYLIRKGFYNKLKFHRVIENFMVQGGCPLGTGTGGPKNVGINAFEYQGQMVSYPFKDEFQSGRVFDKPGLLAMANAGLNTNGSQFFITHIVTDWLTNKHTIFGEVKSDIDQGIVNSIITGDKILEIQIL